MLETKMLRFRIKRHMFNQEIKQMLWMGVKIGRATMDYGRT